LQQHTHSKVSVNQLVNANIRTKKRNSFMTAPIYSRRFFYFWYAYVGQLCLLFWGIWLNRVCPAVDSSTEFTPPPLLREGRYSTTVYPSTEFTPLFILRLRSAWQRRGSGWQRGDSEWQ